MKIKLIDYQENFKVETIGTCEICFGTMGCSNPVFTFQKENKEKVEVNGYYWDWGDYSSVETIANVIDFAEYICDIDFQEDENTFTFGWLDNLVSEYNSTLRSKRND